MPPIKGRMMGLQPATPAYRATKSIAGLLEKKPRDFGQGTNIGMLESAEKLKRLRIPDKICKNLPSVKNFSEDVDFIGDFKCITDEDVKKVQTGLKRSRSLQGKFPRCQLVAECEQKFPGIIWDVGFLSTGDIYVCYGDGIVICNRDLKVQTTLDRIKLAGGADVMPNGNIVAVDRFNDTVNTYSPDGKFISSFPGGSSPMNVAINRDNFIVVTDVGDKCVQVYSVEGTLINTIAQKGRGYELQWPLYIQVTSDNSFVVSDVLQRKVFMFDEHGSFIKALQLKTYGANSVLRPHGICLGKNKDFFVIDNALDTVELFRPDDMYMQTVLPSEEGASIKPKVLGMSEDGYLVVGGMTGTVKLFKFLEFNDGEQDIKLEQPLFIIEDIKNETADMDVSESTSGKDRIEKIDYKTEYSDNDCVIVID